MKNRSDEMLEMVAKQFGVLADPLRLLILHCVGSEEKAVREIVGATGASQPNVSKHLKIMRQAGILVRRQERNSVYYRVTDPGIFEMCDLVCGALKETSKKRAAVWALL